MLKKFLGGVLALAFLTVPSLAATYTLEIKNEDRLPIFKVWVREGEVQGAPCERRQLCTKTIVLPDNVCRTNITVTVSNGRGPVRTYVNWCASGGTVEVVLTRGW